MRFQLIHWTVFLIFMLFPLIGWGKQPAQNKIPAKNRDFLSYLRDPESLLERISRLPPEEIESLVGDMDSLDIEVLVERLKKLEERKQQDLISPASF